MADATTPIYQPITLTVSNAQPGAKISVQLTKIDVDIAFSTGDVLHNIAGINVTSQSGPLPLQQFSMNSSQTTLVTASGGGGGSLVLSVGAWLVANPDIKYFYLSSSSDPGVMVTAAIGNSQAQVVNPTLTTFPWNPV